MYYSICAPAVFNKMSISEALYKIRDCGATAFEIWSWWDQDIEAIQFAKEETGLKMSAICTRFIPLTDPKMREAYVQGVKETIEIAQKLQCTTIISQVGNEIEGLTREEQCESIIAGLKECVPFLSHAGITLVIEPLNTYVDHKGYYLYRSDESFSIVKAVGSKQIKVLYDVYHQQIMEGNLIATITENIDWIGHFHIAGVPGRKEPLEENEIHYPTVLKRIAQLGYSGAVGLEYYPEKEATVGVCQLLSLELNR